MEFFSTDGTGGSTCMACALYVYDNRRCVRYEIALADGAHRVDLSNLMAPDEMKNLGFKANDPPGMQDSGGSSKVT